MVSSIGKGNNVQNLFVGKGLPQKEAQKAKVEQEAQQNIDFKEHKELGDKILNDPYAGVVRLNVANANREVFDKEVFKGVKLPEGFKPELAYVHSSVAKELNNKVFPAFDEIRTVDNTERFIKQSPQMQALRKEFGIEE